VSQSGKQARRKATLEVVENQVRENNPPETRQTLERLIASDIPKEEAMRLIGCVVASEMFEVLNQGKPFDLKRYITALNALPTLPWDSEKP
jgi:hypothetical protein